jgi:hypothetical protein
MVVIVDYDNIPIVLRAKGPRSVAERILELVSPFVMSEDTAITFKLYGGWYSLSSFTPAAQILHSAIYDDFPFVWTLPAIDARRLPISASLAHSLEIDPKHILLNTFRDRSRRRKGRWDQPSVRGCAASHCPLSLAIEHVQADRCSISSCTIKPSDLITPEPEQKMVDTMMVADIIHIANRGDESLAVVTSDDDVWPGIISAMISGIRVLHVQPRPSVRVWPYAQTGKGRYVAVPF